MAINITDDGKSIKVELTLAYTYDSQTLNPSTTYFEKSETAIKAIGQKVILEDDKNSLRFLYSDITSPAAASAQAVAALIEAFKETESSITSSVDIGDKADAQASTDTGTFSLIALFKRLLAKLTSGINTGGITALVTSTPVLSVAGAYASGDYIGTTTTPQAFANAVRSSGSKGIIKSMTMSDKVTTAAVAMELWVFSATFVAPTDNAAWAITDAENLTCLGVIPIPAAKWYATSNNKKFTDDTLSIVISPAVTSLFYALVARGTTPTWANGDLEISLGILQD